MGRSLSWHYKTPHRSCILRAATGWCLHGAHCILRGRISNQLQPRPGMFCGSKWEFLAQWTCKCGTLAFYEAVSIHDTRIYRTFDGSKRVFGVVFLEKLGMIHVLLPKSVAPIKGW